MSQNCKKKENTFNIKFTNKKKFHPTPVQDNTFEFM